MSRRINDRSSPYGKKVAGQPAPAGCTVKTFDSVRGDGKMDNYLDTNEGIQKLQRKSVSKAKGQSQPNDRRY